MKRQGVEAMRILAVTAFVIAMAAGRPALAQITGQPVAAHAAYSVEPFTPPNAIMIQGSGVRLRAEPFANAQTPVLSSGSTGLVLNVVGIVRQPDWNWYQVVLKSGQRAFIRSDLTSAPSRGGGTAAPGPVTPQPVPQRPIAIPAPTPVAPLPSPTPFEATPVPAPATPPVTQYPTLGPAQPLEPPAVQLAPPAQPVTPPATTNRGSIDLPLPGDPSGLQSH